MENNSCENTSLLLSETILIQQKEFETKLKFESSLRSNLGRRSRIAVQNGRLQIGLKLSHTIMQIATCAVYFVKIVHCCRMCWQGLCGTLTSNPPIYGES